ncbi:MAG TPA: LTA synthase family protein [Candidatus Binatia bacterium]
MSDNRSVPSLITLLNQAIARVARLAAPVLLDVVCLMITPLIVRLSLLHSEGIRLQRHDVKWLISGLAVVFVAVGLLSLIPKRRRFPFFATISVLWAIAHYVNYETYLALGGVLELAFLPLLFDPTFFVGSATHVSRPVLLIASLVLPIVVAWGLEKKTPSCGYPKVSCVTAIVIAILISMSHKTNILVATWRQTDPVYYNIRELTSHLQIKLFGGAGVSAAADSGVAVVERDPLNPLAPSAESWSRQLKLLRLSAFTNLAPDFKEEVAKTFELDLNGKRWLETAHKKTPNVLFIVIEGLSAAYFREAATSNSFDSSRHFRETEAVLAAQPHVFYQNFMAHNRQTSRGQYAIICGRFPNVLVRDLEFNNIIKDASENKLCLPEILRRKGYSTAFVQASTISFLNTDRFLEKAGFEVIKGNESFSNRRAFGFWGVDDATLYSKALDTIAAMDGARKPWFVVAETIGTHHPYPIPDEFKKKTKLTDAAAAFAFADQELADFLRELERRKIFDSTIVFIMSDESQGNTSLKDKDIMSTASQSWIPMIVIAPEKISHKVQDIYTHRDLAVSVLDYMAEDLRKYNLQGRSMFRTYGHERVIPFGNIYHQRVGMIDPRGFYLICDYEFSACSQFKRARDSVFPEEGQRLPFDESQVKELQYLLFLNEYRDDAPVLLENQNVALVRLGPRDVESKEKFDFIGRRYFNVPPFQAACLVLDFALQKGELALSVDFTVGHGKSFPFSTSWVVLEEGEKFKGQACYAGGPSGIVDLEPRVIVYNKAADKSVLDVRNAAFSLQKSSKASHHVINDFRKID